MRKPKRVHSASWVRRLREGRGSVDAPGAMRPLPFPTEDQVVTLALHHAFLFGTPRLQFSITLRGLSPRAACRRRALEAVGLDLARPDRGPRPVRCGADHRYQPARRCRVRQTLPASRQGGSRRMRGHNLARHRHASYRQRCPSCLDLAADAGRGGKRGSSHLHRPGSATCPDRLRPCLPEDVSASRRPRFRGLP